MRLAVFEDGIRFIGVVQYGRCAGGGVLKGLRCGIESGVADVADRAFVGTGASGGVDTHDESVTQVRRWLRTVAEHPALGNVGEQAAPNLDGADLRAITRQDNDGADVVWTTDVGDWIGHGFKRWNWKK